MNLLVELGYRPAWQEDADCHGKTAMFFSNATSAAKRICQTCPVRRECLTYAQTHRPRVSGVWGGRNF